MGMSYIVIAAIGGYLVGSISFARLVAALAGRPDALERVEMSVEGTTEPLQFSSQGATTVSLALGKRWGFVTMVLDMAKIALPTLVARLMLPQEPYHLIVAAAGMVGHIWPIYYRFRGGRGMSAMYGGMLVIDWPGIFASFVGGILLGIVVLRNGMLAYLASFWLLIPWLWFRTHDWRYVAYALFVNALFVVGMIPEIKQYKALREQGADTDPAAVLQRTAMGRGMLRIARLFGANR